MFVIKKILNIVNIILAICLLLTYIPYHIDTNILPKLTLLSYAYPFAFAGNAFFVLFWLIFGPRKRILTSAIVIALHLSFVLRLVNFSGKDIDGEKDIKVLTYNVRNFMHKLQDGNSEVKKDNMDSIIAYIHNSKADILCFQDYSSGIKDSSSFHHRLTKVLKYRYCYYFGKENKSGIRDCAIYSKYHIKEGGTIDDSSSRNYSLIYADLVIDNRVVRVYNLHLESYMLGEEEQETYSSIIHGDINKKEEGKGILRKLIIADSLKKEQLKTLIPNLQQTQLPYIVTGDFNSTPFSYVYKMFNKDLSDAFVSKGSGIGRTYNGVFPAYRIDYIFYQKKFFKAKSYQSPALDFSDHYPVEAIFELKNE